MEIEINGDKYRLKPQKPKKRMPKSMMLASMLVLSNPYSLHTIGGSMKTEGYYAPSEWLINEYKLVMNKQSNLSRRRRDNVVNSFHHYFEQIIEPPQNNQ